MLSKGHAVPALYTVLARAGYFPEEQLITLRKLGSQVIMKDGVLHKAPSGVPPTIVAA